MARVQVAYLNSKDVPARKALQEAVYQLGFKVTLDESYVPFKTAGYLPCTLDGEDAGFDMRFQNVATDTLPAPKSSIGTRDTAILFRWAGDPREQLAALAVCTALVKQFGAIVYEPDQDILLSFDQQLSKVRDTQGSL